MRYGISHIVGDAYCGCNGNKFKTIAKSGELAFFSSVEGLIIVKT